MTIIVQTLAGQPDANSYVSVQELRGYAGLRGETLPENDLDCEPLLIKAMDYLESFRYKGTPSQSINSLSFPREDIWVDGTYYDTGVIFQKIKDAQMLLAITSQTVPLQPSFPAGSKGPVMSQSVYGAVSRTFAKPSDATTLAPYLPAVRKLLSSFLAQGMGAYAAVIRV